MEGFETTLIGYVTKMALALLFLGAAGYFVVKRLPARFRVGAGGALRLVGVLSVGRDAVYLLRTGPDVIALFVSKNHSAVVGRWDAEKWDAYEKLREEGDGK